MNRKLLPALLAVLALCAIAAGQEAKLVGPDKVEVGQSFDVTVEGLSFDLSIFSADTSPPQVEWRVIPGNGTFRSRMEVLIVVDPVTKKPRWVVSPYATITFAEPGKVGIALMVVQNGVGMLLVHEVAVGPFPDPVPPPPPPPPPPPDEKVWGAILIEESGQRTWQLAAILTSKKLETFFSEERLSWSVTDQDDASTDLKPYVDQAKKDGIPMLFIMGVDGHEFYAGPVPNKVDDVIKLVKQFAKEED